MNFYPHHISDFNNATRHLTRVERSVYRDAIEMYYDKESPIPADIELLNRKLLCITEEEKQALLAILSEFFTLSDGLYRHDRCDLEIEKYRKNTSAKAKAGIASAAKRQQKSTGVQQKLTRVHNQEPITNNQEPLTNIEDKSSIVGTGVPTCPHREITDLYNRILPELQQVIFSRWEGSARAKHLQARWRESDKHQSLQFWEDFFTALRQFPFYLGENNRTWKADLGWLVERRNFDKLIERFVTGKRQ
jgi:uncharacterized protein YdaU (DUF1376 family)